IGVEWTPLKTGDTFGESLRLRTVASHDLCKALLVLHAVDVEDVANSVVTLACLLDPGHDPESGQQGGHVVDKLPAGRRVVDPRRPVLAVPRHRATRRPEVPEEKRDVLPRQGEDLRRNELLVATQSEQPQAVQPLGDGVSVPM